MTQDEICDYIRFVQKTHDINGFIGDGSNKDRFLKEGRMILKAIAAKMGFNSQQCKIRINKAGPAVSGDVYFETDTLEACFTHGGFNGFYYRWRSGRQSGPNNWMQWSALADLRLVAKVFAAEASRSPAAAVGAQMGA